jgi:hypothetical protein
VEFEHAACTLPSQPFSCLTPTAPSTFRHGKSDFFWKNRTRIYKTGYGERKKYRPASAARKIKSFEDIAFCLTLITPRSLAPMSSKKRKNGWPENALVELEQAADLNAKPSQPLPLVDDGDDSNWRQQLAAMQARLDVAHAEQAASQAEIVRLRAAAQTPCPRCNFHADWTVRVRTMAGQVHSIACPDGPATLIAHVKRELGQFDPKFHIQQQLTLVLPCDLSSSADSAESALVDHMTLASYGVSNDGLLELFLVDMDWDNTSLAIIERIRHGGTRIDFADSYIHNDEQLALSWALVNAVCFSLI